MTTCLYTSILLSYKMVRNVSGWFHRVSLKYSYMFWSTGLTFLQPWMSWQNRKNHKSHLTLWISPVFELQCKTEGSSFIPFNCTPLYIQVYPYNSGTGVPTELEMTGHLLSCLFLAILCLLINSKGRYLLRQKAEDLLATPASSKSSESHRTSLSKAVTDQESTEKYS